MAVILIKKLNLKRKSEMETSSITAKQKEVKTQMNEILTNNAVMSFSPSYAAMAGQTGTM